MAKPQSKGSERLYPEPEPVTVIVPDMYFSLPREAGPRQQLWKVFHLGLNPKTVGKGNGLGLGETPRCAITGKIPTTTFCSTSAWFLPRFFALFGRELPRLEGSKRIHERRTLILLPSVLAS